MVVDRARRRRGGRRGRFDYPPPVPLASKLRGAGPGLWLVLGQLAFLASGYVVNVVGGRVLGPADYGLLGIVLVLTTATHIIQGQAGRAAGALARGRGPPRG